MKTHVTPKQYIRTRMAKIMENTSNNQIISPIGSNSVLQIFAWISRRRESQAKRNLWDRLENVRSQSCRIHQIMVRKLNITSSERKVSRTKRNFWGGFELVRFIRLQIHQTIDERFGASPCICEGVNVFSMKDHWESLLAKN